LTTEYQLRFFFKQDKNLLCLEVRRVGELKGLHVGKINAKKGRKISLRPQNN
jgi:hypothetical protein